MFVVVHHLDFRPLALWHDETGGEIHNLQSIASKRTMKHAIFNENQKPLLASMYPVADEHVIYSTLWLDLEANPEAAPPGDGFHRQFYKHTIAIKP